MERAPQRRQSPSIPLLEQLLSVLSRVVTRCAGLGRTATAVFAAAVLAGACSETPATAVQLDSSVISERPRSNAVATPQQLIFYGGVLPAGSPIGTLDLTTDFTLDSVTWAPAYLTGGSHPWGLVEGTNSWINCGPVNETCLDRTVYYRVRFYVPEGWSEPMLTFDIKADNAGTVFLNGTMIGQRFESNGSIPAASLSTSMRTGLNEMILKVEDWGGLAGFNYRAIVNVLAPQPLVQLPPGVETITITPTTGQSKSLGAADPTLTYTSSHPNIALTGALGRLAGEAPGTYPYNTGTLTAPAGYVVVLSPNVTFEVRDVVSVTLENFRFPVRTNRPNIVKPGQTVPLTFRLVRDGAGL